MMGAFTMDGSFILSSWQLSSIVLSLLAILAVSYLAFGIRHRLANRGLVSTPDFYLATNLLITLVSLGHPMTFC